MSTISLGKVFIGTFLVSAILTARLLYKGIEKSEFLFCIILVLTTILSLILIVFNIATNQEVQIETISNGIGWIYERIMDLLNKNREVTSTINNINDRLFNVEETSKTANSFISEFMDKTLYKATGTTRAHPKTP